MCMERSAGLALWLIFLRRDEAVLLSPALRFNRYVRRRGEECRQLSGEDGRERVHEVVLFAAVGELEREHANAAVRRQQRRHECASGVGSTTDHLLLSTAERGGDSVIGMPIDLGKSVH